MKRLLVISGMVLLSAFTAVAQGSPKMGYEEFRNWMKSSTLNGFSFVDSDQNSGDYTASFMQLNKMINVKLTSNKFESYKSANGYDGSQPYEIRGVKSVYINGSNASYMYTFSPKLNSTIIISTSYCTLDKPSMEKILVDMGAGSKF